ncbi:MAG: hypothetical protein R2744_10435 [Bacteroidales bacterium]
MKHIISDLDLVTGEVYARGIRDSAGNWAETPVFREGDQSLNQRSLSTISGLRRPLSGISVLNRREDSCTVILPRCRKMDPVCRGK